MRDRSRYLLIVLGLGTGLILALVWLAGGKDLPVALAQPGTGVVRVATTGNDAPGCGGEANPCRTVQYAVDEALPGEEIRVASGVYTGVNGYGGLAQVVYLSKTLTIHGGYTVTNWTTPDPEANPTTLDAQGQGRVLVITGSITPTIEGLRLTGGDATGLGGSPGEYDTGGGVYVYGAAATISDCLVYSNTASIADSGWGGALFLWDSAGTLSGNVVRGNTASSAADGHGGGLFLWQSAATLSGNTVASNTATTTSSGGGGGLYLSYSPAMLSGNMIINNVGSTADSGWGGGLFLWESAATLSGNTVQGNVASVTDAGFGGGLQVVDSPATLSDNLVISNTASTGEHGVGGGLLIDTSNVTLNSNVVQGNIASTALFGDGGGFLILLIRA